jgi:hypothetical protein
MNPEIFSNLFEVEFSNERDAFLILHPDRERFTMPLVEVKRETLDKMSFEDASKFIGERLILLMPTLRKMFEDYLWSSDGQPPKKVSECRRGGDG